MGLFSSIIHESGNVRTANWLLKIKLSTVHQAISEYWSLHLFDKVLFNMTSGTFTLYPTRRVSLLERYIYTDHRYKYTLERNEKMRKIITRCTYERLIGSCSQMFNKSIWAYWMPDG